MPRKISILDDIKQTHKHWKSGKKSLKWWRNHTGYYGYNIRKLCKIPLSHPPSSISIDYIYLLQLEYVVNVTISKSARTKALGFRQEVTQVLTSKLKQKKVSVENYSFITTVTS
jgi:hypothetical protein